MNLLFHVLSSKKEAGGYPAEWLNVWCLFWLRELLIENGMRLVGNLGQKQ